MTVACAQYNAFLGWPTTSKRIKVKASVLDSILRRVTSEEELKYAGLGLKIFKTQNIDLKTKTASLFIKVSQLFHSRTWEIFKNGILPFLFGPRVLLLKSLATDLLPPPPLSIVVSRLIVGML